VGLPWTLKFTGTTTAKSSTAFPKKCGWSDSLRAPALGSTCHVRRSGHIADASPCVLSDLLVSLASLGAESSSQMGWGAGVGWGYTGEQSQQGGGRGTSVWAGVHGVGPGSRSRAAPPGCGSGAGLSQKTPVAVTGRHLAAFPGQAEPGLCIGSTHARSSGWASAGLPGCLG
jgi:hypothetical protein